jgi:hypothetical protein
MARFNIIRTCLQRLVGRLYKLLVHLLLLLVDMSHLVIELVFDSHGDKCGIPLDIIRAILHKLGVLFGLLQTTPDFALAISKPSLHSLHLSVLHLDTL